MVHENRILGDEPDFKARLKLFAVLLCDFELCPRKVREGSMVGEWNEFLEGEPYIWISVRNTCFRSDYNFLAILP